MPVWRYHHWLERGLTGLVLDNELEVLDVIAVDIASHTREGKVGSQTRIGLDHVRGRIARTDVGISVPDLECVDRGSDERCIDVRKRYCSGEACTRDERKHQLVIHFVSRLGGWGAQRCGVRIRGAYERFILWVARAALR
jgi:hypothetical protein